VVPGLDSSFVPSVPSWAQRFRSDDLDEVRAFMTRISGEHSRVGHCAGALGFELAWVPGADASVGWARAGLGMTVRGAVSDATLHLMMPFDVDYRVGRRKYVAGGTTVMFLAPGWEYTRRSRPGPTFALSISGRRLADEIAARYPERRDATQFRTRLIDLPGTKRAVLASAVRQFLETKAPASAWIGATDGEAGVVAAVADLLLGEEAVARVDPMAAARIADVEDWIDSRLAEPITIDRLCEVAGVGERRLQKAFESRRGVSPMRFVTERRLAEAHRRLLRDTRNDVTHIALGLGFRHMGRFALEYRAAFGESPSQTRRRAR
jgi:AraC-like DNA-binding protein